jgi:hypothetical protein
MNAVGDVMPSYLLPDLLVSTATSDEQLVLVNALSTRLSGSRVVALWVESYYLSYERFA